MNSLISCKWCEWICAVGRKKLEGNIIFSKASDEPFRANKPHPIASAKNYSSLWDVKITSY